MIMKCGCKGERFCLICKENKIINLSKSQKFYFCLLCFNKAYKSYLDHNLHTDDLIEYKDYLIIEGIFLIENVINEETEFNLVNEMDQNQWLESQSGRRKQDFGPKVNFKKKKINSKNFTGLPYSSMNILENLIKNNVLIKQNLRNFDVVEVCNLEYLEERGSAIIPHFDDFWLWGNRLVTLNLLSDTKLILTKDKKLKDLSHKLPINNFNFDDVEIVIDLKRQSLLVLFDEARYEWLHEIRREDIKNRRIAITFRELSNSIKDNENAIELLKISLNRI